MSRLSVLMATVFSVICVMCGMLTVQVYAQGVRFDPSTATPNNIQGCSGSATNSSVCKDIHDTSNPLFGPTGILTKVAGVFGLLTGVIATFMIILSGARYVMSGGDPGKTATAKNGILYSAIGIGVSLVAGVLVRYVLTKL